VHERRFCVCERILGKLKGLQTEILDLLAKFRLLIFITLESKKF
jgi:hypothetical protein